jgi:hypothetical protein
MHYNLSCYILGTILYRLVFYNLFLKSLCIFIGEFKSLECDWQASGAF